MCDYTIRDLAIAILDDDKGIPVDGWNILKELLEESMDRDIIAAVQVIDGRYFLPYKHGLPK